VQGPSFKTALHQLEKILEAPSVNDAKFEARMILCEVTGFSVTQIITAHPKDFLSEESFNIAIGFANRRALGEPMAYIFGHWGFYKSDFIIEPGVLVPRPETELIVEVALKLSTPAPTELLDLGCGSGCVGLSLLKEWPGCFLTAVDSSSRASEVTVKNSLRFGLSQRVRVLNQSAESLKENPDSIENYHSFFDVVVGNPPYIPTTDRYTNVDPWVNDYEPKEALYAGEDGLNCIRSWSKLGAWMLKPYGRLIFEIGAGQSAYVKEIIVSSGFSEIEFHQDLAGHQRVVSARK
jgi:release factor glutamine methyltransferase